ncbi:MAG: DNRLRE domain-containing protein [Bacteroidales bacterium]
MKKCIKYIFVVAILTTSMNVLSQTTIVTFKPDATIGKDALIKRTVIGNTTALPIDNYGDSPEMAMVYVQNPQNPYIPLITFNNVRSLIKFEELNSIPQNAVITNAVLKFYGVPNSTTFPQGNYPVCNIKCLTNNDVWLQRITGSWDENNVKWENQPSSTTTDRVKISHSTLQWNYNGIITSSLNVAPQLINMLNLMRNNNDNNGFLMILDNESAERSILFASSDHSNSALWPELTVTYEVIDCDFTTCVSSTDQNLYTFSAENTNGNHAWELYNENWDLISTFTSSSFDYTFSSGVYSVVHNVSTNYQSCSSYITLCIDPSQQNVATKSKKDELPEVIPTSVIIGNSIKVYPNPSFDKWNVTLNSVNTENVDIIVTDCVGKTVYCDKINLSKGDNNFTIDGSSFSKGIYLIKIKGETTNFTQKLSKN